MEQTMTLILAIALFVLHNIQLPQEFLASLAPTIQYIIMKPINVKLALEVKYITQQINLVNVHNTILTLTDINALLVNILLIGMNQPQNVKFVGMELFLILIL